jgi:hypothetical protein
MDSVTVESVGDLAVLIPSFRRHLRASDIEWVDTTASPMSRMKPPAVPEEPVPVVPGSDLMRSLAVGMAGAPAAVTA